MIQSLFILTSTTGQILIERHFRGIVTDRDVCHYWMMYSTASTTIAASSGAMMSMTHHPSTSSSPSSTLATGSGTGNNNNNQSNIITTTTNNTNHCVPIMEIPSVKQGTTLYAISIRRDNLYYLAICSNLDVGTNPLMILEFLNRFYRTLQEYFCSNNNNGHSGCVDDITIKDNFITIYQLLEEMIDFGWPLTTEINALKVLIRPPTILSKLFLAATGQSTLSSITPTTTQQLPTVTPDSNNNNSSHLQQTQTGVTLVNMPWRAAGVYYTNNEIYVDIIEEVDAIVDQRSGKIVTADVQGSIICQSHLSGVPDLLLTFNDPNIIANDCSFHPCVRYEKFERDHVVSFVPPDGNFELMRYRIDIRKVHNIVPPIYCQVQWSSGDHPTTTTGTSNRDTKIVDMNPNVAITQNGRLSIQIGIATLSSLIFSSSVRANGGKTTIEDIVVQIPFPKGTNVVNDFRVNMGTVVYDEVYKVAKWSVITSLDTTISGGTTTSVTLPATFTCKFTILPSSNTTTTTTSGTAVSADTFSSYQLSGMSVRRQKICERYQRKQQKLRRQRQQHHSTSDWLVSPPNIGVSWKIPLASISGIAVSGLSVMGETYRPYKGVRNITQAGIYQIRCT